jgi:hypothetical protein
MKDEDDEKAKHKQTQACKTSNIKNFVRDDSINVSLKARYHIHRSAAMCVRE